MPFSGWLSHVSPGWNIPVRAVLVSVIVTSLLSLINIGSYVALNAVSVHPMPYALTLGSSLTLLLLPLDQFTRRRVAAVLIYRHHQLSRLAPSEGSPATTAPMVARPIRFADQHSCTLLRFTGTVLCCLAACERRHGVSLCSKRL